MRLSLRPMNQNQDLKISLTRSHEAHKERLESGILNFVVCFVAACDNQVLLLTQELDSKFDELVKSPDVSP